MAFTADEVPPLPAATSKIDRALAALPPEEREVAETWLRSGASFPTIVARFKAEGISISASGISRWRHAQGLPGKNQ